MPPDTAHAASPLLPAPTEVDRAARNAANARSKRRVAFVKRALELGQATSEEDALAAFNEAEIAREAYIADNLARNPTWNRARAASGWQPHGVGPRSPSFPTTHHISQDNGWCIDRKSWAFQRALWRRCGVALAFGEFRRMVKQASVQGTVLERRANYRRRAASVTLDNGQAIDIDICGARIFGFADTTLPAYASHEERMHKLSETLRDKYGIDLEPGMFKDIERQVRASRHAPAVPLPGRAIYRVAIGDQPEVYVLARKGQVLEAKRAEGVRKALAKQPMPPSPPPREAPTRMVDPEPAHA